MKYAVFTVGLPELTPEQAVTTLRDLGYDGVEWRVTDQAPAGDEKPGFWAGNRCTWPLSSLIEDAPRIAALAAQAGLDMPSVGTYVTCDDLASVEHAMQGVARMGASQLRVNVPKYDGGTCYRRARDRALAQYREVADLARQYNLRALIELHHGSLIPSASAAAAFLDPIDPRYVGAIHDAGNMVYEGYEQYRLGLEMLGPYLAHVHLKNAAWQPVGIRADGSTEWRAGWAPLAQGVVDMPALLRALREVGYDGWVSFEDFSLEQPLHVRLRDNLAYVKRVAQSIAEEAS
ncbi:MAG TPA: sugar phosphate isomerase/epimerase family protein [Herpetosiphonaceae bacterium]